MTDNRTLSFIGAEEVEQATKLLAALRASTHPNVAEVMSFDFAEDIATISLSMSSSPLLTDWLTLPFSGDVSRVKVVQNLADTLTFLTSKDVAIGSIEPSGISVRDDETIFIADVEKAYLSPEAQSQNRNTLSELAIHIFQNGLTHTKIDSDSLQLVTELRNGRFTFEQLVTELRSLSISPGDPFRGNHLPTARPLKRFQFSKAKLITATVAAVALAIFVFAHSSSTQVDANSNVQPKHESSTSTTNKIEPSTTSTSTSSTTSSTQVIKPIEVLHDGNRYHVGNHGDIVLIGRWGCASDDQLVLYRPGDGRLFYFPLWAKAYKEEPSVEFAKAQPNAKASIKKDNGCDIVAIEKDGSVELFSLKEAK